jgi:hypothetical protein
MFSKAFSWVRKWHLERQRSYRETPKVRDFGVVLVWMWLRLGGVSQRGRTSSEFEQAPSTEERLMRDTERS